MASVVVVLALATALFWLGLVIYFLKGSRASERRPALRGTRVAYKQGDKVIWNGDIYESLGNNENEQPDSAEEGTNAPWRIIGPVL